MARLTPNSTIYILAISMYISWINTIGAIDQEEYSFVKVIDRRTFRLKKEKLSHFRLYWHDLVGGKSPTSVMVVQPPFNSTTGFGFMNIIDNPLTIGPELSSRIVGRAQGFYASASLEELGLLMVMNFAFTDEAGKYNGSTFTVMGRNAVFKKVREMSVVGGSGLFRFARGYAEAKTHKFDLSSGNATIEYNVYVLHF